MKKKCLALLLAAAQLVLLSGCWNYQEIEDQIGVSGIAIDIGTQGCRCHLSAEILSLGGGGEDEKLETHVVTSDGDTIFEAINNLSTMVSKRLYFGHCKVLIIGEPLAKYGISQVLDLPVRNQEIRADMDVFVAKDSSGEALLRSEGVTAPVVSYKISDLLKAARKTIGDASLSKDYLLYDKMHGDGSYSVTVPALETCKFGDEQSVRICGSGVFFGDRLIGYLNEDQSKVLSLMSGRLKSGLITTENAISPYYNTSFQINRASAKTAVVCQPDGGITAEVRVKLRVSIGETQIPEDFRDPENLKKAREKLQTSLCSDMGHLVENAQKTYGSDFFGIGRKIEEQDPSMWSTLQKNWNKTFPKVRFKLSCEAEIVGSGVANIAPM